MSILSFIVSFFVGAIFSLIGFYFGNKKGKIDGINEFMSILKVYDYELVLKIGDVLHKVALLSEDEKRTAFITYLEKHKNIS